MLKAIWDFVALSLGSQPTEQKETKRHYTRHRRQYKDALVSSSDEENQYGDRDKIPPDRKGRSSVVDESSSRYGKRYGCLNAV